MLEPAFTVVAVENGRDFSTAAVEAKPQVALVDISLPDVNGMDAARQLLQLQPACKILFVSGYADPAYVEQARSLGASGYVLKTRIQAELLSAIELALEGKFYASKF